MRRSVISIENLSKKYHIGEIGTGTLSHDLHRAFVLMLGKDDPYIKIKEYEDSCTIDENEIWALRNVSIDINQGEILGIIGKNGAGKSTLLKLVSRITAPTAGEIRVKGRIATLLEVGTGMHPEMTARENIYLNGTLLGMNKSQIESKFHEIIDFAGVEKYVDTPIKRYSSGMKTRLGFAVAAHMDPDILIVDEVLAVGDIEFQRKCIGKMNDVAREGRTILFVSHNMSAVRQLCTRAIVIHSGSIKYEGTVNNAIEKYHEISFSSSLSVKSETSKKIDIDDKKPICISGIEVCQYSKRNPLVIEYDEGFQIKLSITVNETARDYYNAVIINDVYGNTVIFSTDEDNVESPLVNAPAGNYTYLIPVPGKILKPGIYYITVAACKQKIGKIDRHDAILSIEIIDTKSRRGVKKLYRSTAVVAPEINWQLETTN